MVARSRRQRSVIATSDAMRIIRLVQRCMAPCSEAMACWCAIRSFSCQAYGSLAPGAIVRITGHWNHQSWPGRCRRLSILTSTRAPKSSHRARLKFPRSCPADIGQWVTRTRWSRKRGLLGAFLGKMRCRTDSDQGHGRPRLAIFHGHHVEQGSSDAGRADATPEQRPRRPLG